MGECIVPRNCLNGDRWMRADAFYPHVRYLQAGEEGGEEEEDDREGEGRRQQQQW